MFLVSYFGLFLMNLFTAEDVLIKNNLPAMLEPGSKTLVEMTIEKGAIQGFSKLELTAPTGFTIEAAEIKGASFTFSNQQAKFVWMTLPSEGSFTITYYIESLASLDGPFDIDGTFSYVKENKRLDIKIPSKTIIVKKGVGPTPEQVAATMPEVRREESVVDMYCSRTITPIGGNDYMVNLVVNNNSIKGFGKILEILPDHCSTEKVNDGGAVITQDENTIKFVWFEVPTSTSFEVSYKLSCTDPGMPAIKGQLSFTEDGNPVTTEIVNSAATQDVLANQTTTTSSTSTTSEPSTAASTANTETQNTAQNSSTKSTTPTNNSAQNTTTSREEEPVTASNKNNEKPVTSIPSAETGITYKVQIMAAHKVVDKSYFKNKFNFTDKFNIENHEGWVKYTTGKYTEYKDARDARVKITSDHGKLPGPFVTAYNHGERITVQEALLISKQEWYK
jgi:hypothetical protein